jgi:hypothetical protein
MCASEEKMGKLRTAAQAARSLARRKKKKKKCAV